MEQEGEYLPSMQSKFNYANSILQRIDYLQFKATEHYRSGNLEAWFYEWKEIKFQIIGKMSDSEKKDLLMIETKIAFLFTKFKINSKYRSLLIRMIEIYLEKIQTLIEKWGMGLIDKRDETIFA